jgi:hypothetical protein
MPSIAFCLFLSAIRAFKITTSNVFLSVGIVSKMVKNFSGYLLSF